MRILVKAKPKSKLEYVRRSADFEVTVAVKEAPEKGKANEAIIKSLAVVLNIPASSIILISGQASRRKVFEIPVTSEGLKKIPGSPDQIKLL